MKNRPKDIEALARYLDTHPDADRILRALVRDRSKQAGFILGLQTNFNLTTAQADNIVNSFIRERSKYRPVNSMSWGGID